MPNEIKKNISEDFRWWNINETKNYPWRNKARRTEVCTLVNHVEHFLILALTITGSISSFVLPVLLRIPMGIVSSAIGLKFVQ